MFRIISDCVDQQQRMRLKVAKGSSYLKKSFVCSIEVLYHSSYHIVLMRHICVSRDYNPVLCLQSPNETLQSPLIHFDPFLGDSLISHNAVDQ